MLRLIFWVLILFLALSFFGISIQAIVSSPAGQANLNYLVNLSSQAWQWFIQFIQPMLQAVQSFISSLISFVR